MTTNPLSGSELKVRRAVEHFDAVKREISAFFATDPHVVVSRCDLQPVRYAYAAQILSDPPPEISIRIGECLQSLRSALDYLAWQLALQTTPTPPQRTEFPIYRDRTVYRNEAGRKLAAIPDPARDLIEGIQPYNAPDPAENPLWVLHRLNNDDKHRLLHLVATVATGMSGTVEDDFPADATIDLRLNTWAIEHGADLAYVTVTPPRCAKVNMEPATFEFALAFEREEPIGPVSTVVEVLDRCIGAVSATIDAFRRFF